MCRGCFLNQGVTVMLLILEIAAGIVLGVIILGWLESLGQ